MIALGLKVCVLDARKAENELVASKVPNREVICVDGEDAAGLPLESRARSQSCAAPPRFSGQSTFKMINVRVPAILLGVGS